MSGYLARNPLMTDEPQFGPPPVVAGRPVLPNALAMPAGDWRDTVAPQPTQADAADATAKAYTEWLARDRAEQVRLGHVDPATGALTPEGWRAQAQTVAGGFGPADIGALGIGAIKAYHGSPHSFERFDMSKIGTGEGAQAYGHGLYFAENEGVARGYRDKLGGRGYDTDAGTVLPHGDAHDALQEAIALSGTQYHPDQQRAIAGDVLDNINWSGSVAKMAKDFELPGGNWRPGYEAALAKAEELGLKPNKGSMYEVNLNAEPDQMLHWDKPLSEQSPHVQQALAPQVDRIQQQLVADAHRYHNPSEAELASYRDQAEAITSKMTGADIYNKSREALHLTRQPARPFKQSDADIAAALNKAGIPGISYLDAGSRGAGQGSRNHVVFDDATIDILRKYGIAGLIGGGAAATAAGGNQGQNQ